MLASYSTAAPEGMTQATPGHGSYRQVQLSSAARRMPPLSLLSLLLPGTHILDDSVVMQVLISGSMSSLLKSNLLLIFSRFSVATLQAIS